MIFPPLSGMLDPCQSPRNNWKLISFNTTWLHSKQTKKTYFSLSFSPSIASLYLFEQCLRFGVTGTSSVCLPLQDESLHVFPNFKLLWIKAFAKWLNVNVITKSHSFPTSRDMLPGRINSHKRSLSLMYSYECKCNLYCATLSVSDLELSRHLWET